MKTGENNIKQATPYPLHIEKSITNTIPVQTVTEICRTKKTEIEKAKTIPFLDDLDKKRSTKGV